MPDSVSTEVSMMMLLILAAAAAEDLTEMRIRGIFPAVLAGSGITECLASGKDPAETAAAVIPGLMLLAVSAVSDGRIGQGDAYIFTAMGFCTDPLSVFGLMCLSFMAAGAFALIVLLVRGKAASDERFAFIPFVFMAAAAETILLS